MQGDAGGGQAVVGGDDLAGQAHIAQQERGDDEPVAPAADFLFDAFALAALASVTTAAASPAALDCAPGFDAIHTATLAQPGVIPEMTLDAEWNWSAAYSVLDIFTLPNNPAHPAVLHLVLPGLVSLLLPMLNAVYRRIFAPLIRRGWVAW